MNNNIIIGIDGSTVSTGISTYDIDTNEVICYNFVPDVKYKTISSKVKGYKKLNKENKTKAMRERVIFMIANIVKLLENLNKTNNIERIIVEDTYSAHDANTLKMLSRLQGAIWNFAIFSNIPIEFKAPTSWRADLGIPMTHKVDGKSIRYKREELKAFSLEYINKLINSSKIHLATDNKLNDDIAESICLAISSNIGSMIDDT